MISDSALPVNTPIRAKRAVPLAELRAPCPVVVFSHGLGGSGQSGYCAIACELVSRGFVVACVEHRYDVVVRFFLDSVFGLFSLEQGLRL